MSLRWFRGALALMLAAAPLRAQTRACPDGGPLRGDVGIHRVKCVGPSATCSINIRDEHGFRHSFAVEPAVSVLDDAVGGDHPIRIGDTIVSVDGFLITTIEGGRRLANLKAGTRVLIFVRRGDKLIEIAITPRAGCGITSLSVRR